MRMMKRLSRERWNRLAVSPSPLRLASAGLRCSELKHYLIFRAAVHTRLTGVPNQNFH
jgi:hypothetical protein